MHEQAIAQEIITTAKKSANNKRIISVTVEVGDLGHLPANEMKDVLENLLPETKIIIKNKKAVVSCVCGYKGEPEILEKGHDHNVFRCKVCKKMLPKILDGEKIILESLETE